jgi:hypothetical protein
MHAALLSGVVNFVAAPECAAGEILFYNPLNLWRWIGGQNAGTGFQKNRPNFLGFAG